MKVAPPSQDTMTRIMEVFTTICAIDMVSQSIEQLHRILIYDKTRPFSGEQSIFQNRLFLVDDNEYFKELRACFGAHPVKLHPRGREETRFASWPFEPHSGKDSDLQVRLYSSVVGQEDLLLSISYKELQMYLVSRYQYLSILTDAIEKRFASFCAELAGKPIPMPDNPITWLEVLATEAEMRLRNDYYSSTIEELRMIFATSLNLAELRDEENTFKKDLIALIQEIHENLQGMNIVDFKNDQILNPVDYTLDIGYELEKIYGWIFSGYYHPLLEGLLRKLDEVSLFQFHFSILDGEEVTLLKVKLMLRRFMNSR